MQYGVDDPPEVDRQLHTAIYNMKPTNNNNHDISIDDNDSIHNSIQHNSRIYHDLHLMQYGVDDPPEGASVLGCDTPPLDPPDSRTVHYEYMALAKKTSVLCEAMLLCVEP